MTKKRWLPLHEWLVARIKNSSIWKMSEIGSQIMEIKIPKDHIDEIIKVWKERCKELYLVENDHLLNVVADLLEQKKEAEEKASAKTKQDDHSFGTHIKEGIEVIKGS